MNGYKFLLALLFGTAGLPVFAQKWLLAHRIQRVEVSPLQSKTRTRPLNVSYRDPADYVPDTAHLEHTPLRYLRINIHFVNTRDRQYNYDGAEARRFAKELVYYANLDIEKNNQLWQPYRNSLPVIPPRYQYLLTPSAPGASDEGVYFHYNDTLCFYIHKGPKANLDDMRVIHQYQIQADSVLNVFIMPHHPEHRAGGVGVMLGYAIKMAGMFESRQPVWAHRGILNHEAGHFLGLLHAFYLDGCEDTPEHGNPCWNQTAEPPCDTAASNNMMDYNALQNALSPCQIGTVHARMADTSSTERRYLWANWCQRQPGHDIRIADTVVWRSDKDLCGDLYLAEGGFLRIEGRVSLPAQAKISIAAGATLQLGPRALLHNACGQSWQGIELFRRFLGPKAKVQAADGARIRDALMGNF